MDHNLDKPLVQIPLPRQKANFSDATRSYLIDIGRVKELVTVQGYLVDDEDSLGKTKKDNLFTLAKKSRTITITWGTTNQQTVSGNIQKVLVTETPGNIYGGTPPTVPDEKNFAVQLSLMVGEDK